MFLQSPYFEYDDGSFSIDLSRQSYHRQRLDASEMEFLGRVCPFALGLDLSCLLIYTAVTIRYWTLSPRTDLPSRR